MVVFERQLIKTVRFRKVFLPTREQVFNLTHSLRPFDLLRVFVGPTDWLNGVRPVARALVSSAVVDLSKGSDAIYAGMHTNCRYKVRRAEKMHDRFDIVMNTEAARRDFLAFYNAFARGKGKMPLLKPRRFNEYLQHADVFMLYFEDQPTCGRLVLRDEESRTALMLYSGTRRFDGDADTITVGLLNRYLHWHEMQTYQVAGLEKYDFGGTSKANLSGASFKLSFGGQPVMSGYAVYAGAARLPWRIAHDAYAKWTGESARLKAPF